MDDNALVTSLTQEELESLLNCIEEAEGDRDE